MSARRIGKLTDGREVDVAVMTGTVSKARPVGAEICASFSQRDLKAKGPTHSLDSYNIGEWLSICRLYRPDA